MNDLLNKYKKLKDYLGSLGSVAVAFSSGVDSTFLLHAAKDALGENVLAVTASSCFIPDREMEEAKAYCVKLGVRHEVFRADVLNIEGVAENPKNRCYLCKKALFSEIKEIALKAGMKEVLEGSNLDDEGDYRPGMLAISELGIKSPLRQGGFTKEEIRSLSKHFGLPTWNKPSFACLASRVPYGEEITEAKLGMIDQAEAFLLELGFRQLRVRMHGSIARIELLPEDFDIFMEEKLRTKVYEKFIGFGFTYVSLDIKGYRTGSLNESI